jgi:hypothetical protein
MPDDAKPPDAPAAPLGTPADLRELWDRFRKGGMVFCPGDGAPMALSVDAAAGVYRLVCTRCGLASPWFESGPHGLRIRGQSQPSMPARGGATDE